jgi:putative hemolysin
MAGSLESIGGKKALMNLTTTSLVSTAAPSTLPDLTALARRELTHYPRHAEGVPPGVMRSGRYTLRFARTPHDLRAVQRLRFEVFNVELDEGLSGSYATGLDEDIYDPHCHHLMVLDAQGKDVVGTYRLMTSELAQRDALYTSSEFDLSSLPDRIHRDGAEVGRACVRKDHRNGRVLQLLWRGIARYLDWNDKRYVFGCCSIATLEPNEIAGVSLRLARDGHFHARMHAPVRPALRAPHGDCVVASDGAALSPLFSSYLRLGAKVCGGPALDREFGVTDYLVVLDLRDVDSRTWGGLSAPGLWSSDEA